LTADGSIVIDTEINTKGMKPGTEEVEAAVRRMANGIDDLGKKSEIAVQKQVTAFAKLNSLYAAQERKVEKLREALEAYSETKIPTQAYAEVRNQIEKTEQKLTALLERQQKFLDTGGRTNSSTYKKMQYDIEQLNNSLKYAKGELKDLEDSGGAFTLGKDTDKFSQMYDKYATEAKKLKQMNESLGISYNRVKNEFEEYKKRLLGIDGASKKATNSTKKLGIQMKKSQKPTKKYGEALSGVVRRLVMFRLLRSTISLAFRSAREGMENLAQYSPETNKAISNVLSSLTQLKNSFATAFSPVAEYASPVLVEFISLLSEAVTWTSQFFAALTGKDTYSKATKVEEDYGAALKESNKQIKEQEKANKKLTYSFDELIQAGNKSDQGKTGYVGPTPDQMFTTEEVSNDIKARADAVKKIFSGLFAPLKESWLDNGPEVIQSLTNLFVSAKQLAKDVGASFMQVWNVESYGKAITDNLLITFANLVQTVANLVTQFDKAWVSGDTGTNILRHLGDILVTLSGFFRDASESIKDWSANLDFSPLLESFDNVLASANPVVRAIGNLLLWFLNNVLLPITKWGLEQGLPEVFELIAASLDLLYSVIETLAPTAEWFWNTFLQPFGEWSGKVIIAALKKLVNALLKFSDWIYENQSLVESATVAVLAFFAAWKFLAFLNGVSQIIAKSGELIVMFLKLIDAIDPVALSISGIISLVAVLARNWDKMTPTERMISGLLAAASAVGVLAVALGALSGGVGAAVVAASLAAGIAAATIAINAGKRQTQSIYRNAGGGRSAKYASAAATYNMPRLATGTVVPPRAGEFAAILGDNKRETEVVSPLSTMKQALKEALAESGGSRDITVIMEVDGRRFGQAVYKANNEEKQRVGVRMVTV
jgi:predicted  nucleic acid-binding Zn-ribbon protein